MSSEWVLKPLGDLVSLQRGHDLPSQDRSEGSVPIMGSSGVTGFHNESITRGPGVVIGRSGNSMGEVSFSTIDFWPLNTCLYVTDFKGNDERYIYYLLKTINFDQFNSGSAQKSLNRNAVYPFEVYATENKHEQKKIGSILANIENKIELNRQINQTLEHMAQAIFQSWFVDFEPVKAKITAREDWLARQAAQSDAHDDVPQFSSPVCYAHEFADATAAPAPATQADLETFMNRAAMCAISGKTDADLDAMPAADYQRLYHTASLFPDELVESELGEIPKGWAIGAIGDMLEFNPKRSLKKGSLAPYLDMKNVPTSGHLADEVVFREMGSGSKFINGDTLLARITPCLENGKTAFVDFLNDDEVGWGSTEFIVIRPKDGYPYSLGYLLARDSNFRQVAIQSMTGTSGRQRADAKALAERNWVVYPKALMMEFGSFSQRYLQLAKRNGDQISTLMHLRDGLLPRLLSGEIEVPVDV